MHPLHPTMVDAADGALPTITAEALGDAQFKADHGLRYVIELLGA